MESAKLDGMIGYPGKMTSFDKFLPASKGRMAGWLTSSGLIYVEDLLSNYKDP